jgi:hypothetical protein
MKGKLPNSRSLSFLGACLKAWLLYSSLGRSEGPQVSKHPARAGPEQVLPKKTGRGNEEREPELKKTRLCVGAQDLPRI